MRTSLLPVMVGIAATWGISLTIISPTQAAPSQTFSLPNLITKFPPANSISPLIAQTRGKTGPAVTTNSSPAAIELAKHLTKQEVVLYVAYWCPHCHKQKQLFGRQAVSFLTIVECASNGVNAQPQLCEDKGVKGYPSWEINGRMYAGTRSLSQLANLSNYQGNRQF